MGGLHWEAHSRKEQNMLHCLGLDYILLYKLHSGKVLEKSKMKHRPFHIHWLIKSYQHRANQELLYPFCWWENWSLEILRLSQDHATGKWLHLKLTLPTSVGEDKVCLNQREEQVGGSLTKWPISHASQAIRPTLCLLQILPVSHDG